MPGICLMREFVYKYPVTLAPLSNDPILYSYYRLIILNNLKKKNSLEIR